MNDSAALCAIASYLAHDTQLIVMLCIRVIVAITGLCLFVLLFKIQGTYLAFHVNARLLLINHHVWVVLQTISNMSAYSYTLFRFSRPETDPCQYQVSTTMSVFFGKGPAVFTAYGQVWALAAMAVERCFATYKYRDYENRSNGVGKTLVAAQWLMTILWSYLAISGNDFTSMQAYPTFSANASGTLANLVFILAGIEVTSISAFYGLLFKNRGKSKQLSDASLTEKYQIGENIRATQLMIPMVLTHFCFFMPSLISIPVYVKFIDPTVQPRGFIVYLETFNTAPFYCIFLPIVLFWRHKALRQNLRKALGINEISPDAPPDEQHVRHFELLKDMWRGPSEKN